MLLTCSTADETQCSVSDRYIALPGGVALTLTNTTPTTVVPTYSIQNFHGDTALTVGATGVATSSVDMYDPFGQQVASATFGTSTTPSNATGTGMGWATSPNRKQETIFSLAVMQMGARVYIPSLGRFLQPDPVQGGTPNAYTYVLDPVNFADYSGQFGFAKFFKAVAKVLVIAAIVVAAIAVALIVLPALIEGDPEPEQGVLSEGESLSGRVSRATSSAKTSGGSAGTATKTAAKALNNANAVPRASVTAQDSTFKAARLDSHFADHGADMGYNTAGEYLNGARNLMSQNNSGIQTFMRQNGDRLFYNAQTNEFGVLSAEGNIRTYFQPDSGILYWIEQTRS